MVEEIRKRLRLLAEEKFQRFTEKLIPAREKILGVRIPHLRQLARQIAGGDWKIFVAHSPAESLEELMLQGMAIGYAKGEIEEILEAVELFVPRIGDWGVCDVFCSSLKIVAKNRERVWRFLEPYFSSGEEFQLRFAVVMLLCYFVTEEYIDGVLLRLDAMRHGGYYLRMGVAWALSLCFIKFPQKTMVYLQNSSLDDWTYNKALQKICESFRVDPEVKRRIRSMKRKISRGREKVPR